MLVEKMIREEIEEGINKRDLDKVCSFYTEDVVFVDSSNPKQPAVGMYAFRNSMASLFKAFPDMRIKIHRIYSNNDGSIGVAEYTLTGTFKDDLGDIKPTNKKFEIIAASVYELSGDKFSKEILYWDTAHMYKQLGIL